MKLWNRDSLRCRCWNIEVIESRYSLNGQFVAYLTISEYVQSAFLFVLLIFRHNPLQSGGKCGSVTTNDWMHCKCALLTLIAFIYNALAT